MAGLLEPQRRRQPCKTRSNYAIVNVSHYVTITQRQYFAGGIGDFRSGSGPLWRASLGERDRALLRVVRSEHRTQDFHLLAPHLAGLPAARLGDDPLGRRDRQRAVGGDLPGQRKRAVEGLG